MKLLKYLFVLILISLTISCKNEVKLTIDVSENINKREENLQNIEINIKGMTCEIGCAKLIQSKIYKLDGVSHSKVSFTNKIGQFTFDSNKISIEEITNKINGIAGGDLYKVINHTVVKEFTEITSAETK